MSIPTAIEALDAWLDGGPITISPEQAHRLCAAHGQDLSEYSRAPLDRYELNDLYEWLGY